MKQWGFLGVILGLSALGCSDGSADGMGYGGSCGDDETCGEASRDESCEGASCTESETSSRDQAEAGAGEGATHEDEPPADEGLGGEDTPEEPAQDEPATQLNCGTNGEAEYEVPCDELEAQCTEAGGSFLCQDDQLAESCQTWGTCFFIKLQAIDLGGDDGGDGEGGTGGNGGDKAPKEDAPPAQLELQSPFQVELADVSVFECGEGGKMCCLFVPGKGDTSADCGGFLQSCSELGGTPSGGKHAANCQW